MRLFPFSPQPPAPDCSSLVAPRSSLDVPPAPSRQLRLPARRVLVAGLAAALVVVALASGRLAAAWLSQPADVPDHGAGSGGTIALRLDQSATAGQSFVAHHNHLSRIDVVMGLPEDVGSRPRPGTLVFRLRELGAPDSAPDLRRLERPAAVVPPGRTFDYAPGQPGERWVSFSFEPIPPSAGRAFLFILEYPGAPDQERMEVLSFFYNTYPYGSLYQTDEFQLGGSLVFRAFFRGVQADKLRGARDHLVATQPLLRGSRLYYGALGSAYAVLVALLLWHLATRVRGDD